MKIHACAKCNSKFRTFLPNRAGGLVAAGAGAVKPIELGTPLLTKGEANEKDCEAGAGVSSAENLGKEQTDSLSLFMYACILTSMSLSECCNLWLLRMKSLPRIQIQFR